MGGYGPHWGLGGYGFGLIHMIFWVVVLIALVDAVVWLVRSMMAGGLPPVRIRRHRRAVPRASTC